MIAAGYIINTSGKGIPGATVEVISADTLQPLGIGTTANAAGYFRLDIPEMFYAWYLQASSIGYKTTLAEPEQITDNMKWPLPIDVNQLPPVIVTTPGKKQFPVWALLPLLLLVQKKKRVSGINAGTVLLVGGTIVGWSVVNKILQAFGVTKGQGEQQADQQQTNPASPWNPQFYKISPPGSALLTVSKATELAIQINKAFTFFDDNFDEVFGALQQCHTKSQVSFLADIFQQRYGKALITYLQNGSGVTPWDGLSSNNLKIITDYVNRLPNYN